MFHRFRCNLKFQVHAVHLKKGCCNHNNIHYILHLQRLHTTIELIRHDNHYDLIVSVVCWNAESAAAVAPCHASSSMKIVTCDTEWDARMFECVLCLEDKLLLTVCRKERNSRWIWCSTYTRLKMNWIARSFTERSWYLRKYFFSCLHWQPY